MRVRNVVVALSCFALSACCGSSALVSVGSPVPASSRLQDQYLSGFEASVAGEGTLRSRETKLRAGVSYFRLPPRPGLPSEYSGVGPTLTIIRDLREGHGTGPHLGAGIDLYYNTSSLVAFAAPQNSASSMSARWYAVAGLGIGRDRRVLVEVRPGIHTQLIHGVHHSFIVPIAVTFKPL